ncbi:MAG: molybdopterin-synthase adenylyltransferase MoeB [Myxococcota bacterium]
MTEVLSPRDTERYARQLRLREVGPEGQRRLRSAKVLIVGAGGLGSPAALYLAAAGVGQLGLIDDDQVALSNLQRQVLYDETQIGAPKVEAACARLSALNRDIVVLGHHVRFDESCAAALIASYDVVLDGSDNLPTRILLNDVCARLGKPWVYGAVLGMEGQLSVFDATRGPCYLCLYPDAAADAAVPSCADWGVLGVVPGVIGLLQATATLELILGIGEPLIGRLAVVDLLAMRWRELRFHRTAGCPTCVGLTQEHRPAEPSSTFEIDAATLRQRLAYGTPQLIDVRELDDGGGEPLPGATEIPLSQLAERVAELGAERPTVLYCRAGIRSRLGVEILRGAGFVDVVSLRGGLRDWR